MKLFERKPSEKKLAREAICFAIEAIKDDICKDYDFDKNKVRAETILTLAMAMRALT